MIGTSTVEYFFIPICILFLHKISPVSAYTAFIYSPFNDLPIHLERIPYPIHAYLPAEAIFFATVFIPLKYALYHSPTYGRSLRAECRERLFRACNTNLEKIGVSGLWSQILNAS